MKNTKFFFRLLVVILFFVTACGDKEEAPKPPSKTDFLTAKTWKMNKILIMNGIDVSGQPELAEIKGWQFKFKADGSYTLTSAAGTHTGTWAFADNETKLILDPNTTYSETLEITEVKENSLKLRAAREIPDFGQQMVTLELVPAA